VLRRARQHSGSPGERHDEGNMAIIDRLRFKSFRLFPAVAQDFARCVVSNYAAHSASRMRRRATLVEALDRTAVVGPMGRGAGPEQLIDLQLAVKDMALGRPNRRLDVGRREHL
jgi:hypothetical protein